MEKTVFNGKPMVVTDTKEMTNDNSLPDTGSLSWGDSPTALSGTNGVDCMLTGGDVWRQITLGGETENISHDLATTIQGNETHTVQTGNETHTVTVGKMTTTVGEDSEYTVGGNLTETINGEHLSLNVGTKTEVRMNARMVQQANETMETHWTPHIQFKSYVIDIASIGTLEVAPLVNEAFINKLEVGGVQEEFVAVVLGASAFDQMEHALECKIAGVRSDIESLEAEAKLLEAGTIQMINMGITLAVQSLFC
jgi:hypothetical protein